MGLLTAPQQWCRKTQIVQEFKQRKNQEKVFVHRIKLRILFDAHKAAENRAGESSEVIKGARDTKGIPGNRGQLCCKLRNKLTKAAILKLKEF